MKLLNKYLKMGKITVESNEYYQDLVNYKQYPYINFKDFEKNGFSITINNTVNVVRSVNINEKGDFKQIGNNFIQTRSGSHSTILHVIWFIIPTNKKYKLYLQQLIAFTKQNTFMVKDRFYVNTLFQLYLNSIAAIKKDKTIFVGKIGNKITTMKI